MDIQSKSIFVSNQSSWDRARTVRNVLTGNYQNGAILHFKSVTGDGPRKWLIRLRFFCEAEKKPLRNRGCQRCDQPDANLQEGVPRICSPTL